MFPKKIGELPKEGGRKKGKYTFRIL